jgi:hypothetical protein
LTTKGCRCFKQGGFFDFPGKFKPFSVWQVIATLALKKNRTKLVEVSKWNSSIIKKIKRYIGMDANVTHPAKGGSMSKDIKKMKIEIKRNYYGVIYEPST